MFSHICADTPRFVDLSQKRHVADSAFAFVPTDPYHAILKGSFRIRPTQNLSISFLYIPH